MFGQTPQNKPAGSTGFGFGAATTPGGFTFGANTATAKPTATAFSVAPASASTGFTLGATATPAAGSAFQFGTPSAATNTIIATPASKPGFSFGATSLGSTGFSFGSTQTTAATATGTGLSITGLSSTTQAQSTGLGAGLKLQPLTTTTAPGLTLTTPVAPTTVAPFGGFALGGTTTTAALTTRATGLTLGTPATASTATGLSLGTTPASAPSLGQGLKLGATTTTVAATGFSLGLATSTTTPVQGLGGLKPVAAVSSTTGAGGLSAGFKAVGSAGASGLGTSAATTTTTAPTIGLGTTLGAKPVTSTATVVAAQTSTASKLTYKQLEDQINKWALELEDYEGTFLDQAAQVNAWDRLLMENGEKITELNSGVESVKAEQKRLDEELNFIMAQQRELEDLLKPLEDELKKNTIAPGQMQHADREREFTYGLAKDIDGQLKQMVKDLKSIIDHLNTTSSTQQDNEDPIIQVSKILNAHMNSLQWIDQNAALLQRKVDEVSCLSEIRRKEQERNFRLAFD